jgi:hypothetical protein
MTPSTAHRPNRILIALAAAWMVLALALGGTVTADSEPTGPAAGTTPASAVGKP